MIVRENRTIKGHDIRGPTVSFYIFLEWIESILDKNVIMT